MKKLQIIFKDGSSITYTIKDKVFWQSYYARHADSGMLSAILYKSPYTQNDPLILVGEPIETNMVCQCCEGTNLKFSRAVYKKGVLYYRYRCSKCKHYYMVRVCIDCNDCKFMEMTEAIQNLHKDKPDHMCTKFNRRVLHGNVHPRLIPIAKCRLTDSYEPRTK